MSGNGNGNGRVAGDPRPRARGRAARPTPTRSTLLRSRDLVRVGRAADELRNRKVDPKRVTFIIDRNVNYTNICHTDCDFCAFYRRPGDRKEGYLLPKPVIFKKIEETLAIGGTALLMQGGHHPDLGIDFYEDLFRSIKERYRIHLHALSPPEIQHIARRSKLTIPETLTRLRDAGLDSLPGGGAEILVDRVRDIIAPKKTKSAEWLGVMRDAHRLGVSSTATMMYGHVETLEERVEHMRRIRELQDETRGFRAFISWTFQPSGTRLAAQVTRLPDLVRLPAHAGGQPHLPRQRRPHPVELGDAGDEGRPGRARLRRRRHGLGDDRGERRLRRRDDPPRDTDDFVRAIKALGKVPVQRDTLYREVKVWSLSPRAVGLSAAGACAFVSAGAEEGSSVRRARGRPHASRRSPGRRRAARARRHLRARAASSTADGRSSSTSSDAAAERPLPLAPGPSADGDVSAARRCPRCRGACSPRATTVGVNGDFFKLETGRPTRHLPAGRRALGARRARGGRRSALGAGRPARSSTASASTPPGGPAPDRRAASTTSTGRSRTGRGRALHERPGEATRRARAGPSRSCSPASRRRGSTPI